MAAHPLRFTFRLIDLFIDNHAGELVRYTPASLVMFAFLVAWAAARRPWGRLPA